MSDTPVDLEEQHSDPLVAHDKKPAKLGRKITVPLGGSTRHLNFGPSEFERNRPDANVGYDTQPSKRPGQQSIGLSSRRASTFKSKRSGLMSVSRIFDNENVAENDEDIDTEGGVVQLSRIVSTRKVQLLPPEDRPFKKQKSAEIIVPKKLTECPPLTEDDVELLAKEPTCCEYCGTMCICGWECAFGVYKIRVYLHYWLWYIFAIIINGIFMVTYFQQLAGDSNRVSKVNVTDNLDTIAVTFALISMLARNSIFQWVIYWFWHFIGCKCCFSRTIIYHFCRMADCLGGLHSSLGISSFVWNIIYAVKLVNIRADTNLNSQFLKLLNNNEDLESFVIYIGIAVPIIQFIIIVFAVSPFRHWHHNFWEYSHRYLGWTALLCLTIHVWGVYWGDWSGAAFIIVNIMIFLTFYPWLILQRISVKHCEINVLSAKCVSFEFNFDSPIGALINMSNYSWFPEFHTFGVTPLKEKGRSFVLIQGLGDWTRDLIDDLSKQGYINKYGDTSSDKFHAAKVEQREMEKIKEKNAENKDDNDNDNDNDEEKQDPITGKVQGYKGKTRTFTIRRIKKPNFTQNLPKYERSIIIVTGSGLAPILPYLLNANAVKGVVRVIWIARGFKQNYGAKLVDMFNEDTTDTLLLYDTSKLERPNLAQLALQHYRDFDADSVFIVSSPFLSYETSFYLRRCGVCVHAGNFDV